MNKKFFILSLFIVISFNVFSQVPSFGGSFEINMTGYDWVTWSIREKATYVIGWETAMKACFELTNALNEKQNQSEEFMKIIKLYKMFSYYDHMTTQDLILKIEYVYSKEEFKNYPIWYVILNIMNTAWWQ